MKRSTYTPAVVKLAVVFAAAALPNTTVAGPLNRDHDNDNAPGGFGKPSSFAIPARFAMAGIVIV